MMAHGAPDPGGITAGARAPHLFRLAGIFVRYRLRSMRNAVRASRRGRSALFAAIVGVMTAFAYVGLFAQAFSTVTRTVDLTGQLAVLSLVIGTIAFGSLAVRAASSEAVRAGSPENEFLLARPVSLASLVAARGLADAVTDPVGGLFLLPVLIAVTVVWNLGLAAWPVAAAISFLVQIGISMLAYALQLAVVRWVPGRRRRLVWMGLRLVAALSLAMLWMLGTWVMRTPAALAARVAGLPRWFALSPGRLVAAPFAALKADAPGQAAAAVVLLAAAVAGTMLLVVAVARRAGMAGWEEAGAIWAELSRVPAPTARLPTAATKDLRLIVRDRSQLLALIAMPVIFIGVQVFGAAGWDWTKANLGRVSCLAYSLALYMGTIGPLTHMQAERRAFWILRAVPVPLGQLLAAKARAWAIIVGGIAALAYGVLSLSVAGVSWLDRLAAGLLVTAGASGMSFVAIAMASGGADLSDETSAAVGPSTIYAYLFVGGLFNMVLVDDAGGAMRIAGLVLYAFAGWAYWQAGVEQAGFCFDAEIVRARRVRAADGATMLIICAMGGLAAIKGGKTFGREGLLAMQAFQGILLLGVGAAAGVYLARRPRVPARRGRAASFAVGAAAGASVGAIVRLLAGAPLRQPLWIIAGIALMLLAEEAILRGVIQRSVSRSRVVAAVVSAIVGVVAMQLSGAAAGPSAQAAVAGGAAAAVKIVEIVGGQMVAASVYAFSGRVTASWFARVVLVGVLLFF